MKARQEHKGTSGIYVIKNMINDKIYIGKSIDVYKRIQKHILSLNKELKKHVNFNIQKDWLEYGKENFQYKIVERTLLDEQELYDRELYWIQHAMKTNRCYNLRIDSDSKCIVSDETRQRCSEAQIIRFSDPKERDKMSIASKLASSKMTEEGKANMKMNVADNESKRNILQYDKKTNKFIKRWKHFHEISLSYPLFKRNALLSVCNGWKKTYRGYIWRYEMKDTGEIIIPEKKY